MDLIREELKRLVNIHAGFNSSDSLKNKKTN